MASSTVVDFGSERGFLSGWEKLRGEKFVDSSSKKSKEELKEGYKSIFERKTQVKVAKTPVSAESVLESMRRDIQLIDYKDISGLKTAGEGCKGSLRVKARVGAERGVTEDFGRNNRGGMKLRMEIRAKGTGVAQEKVAKKESEKGGARGVSGSYRDVNRGISSAIKSAGSAVRGAKSAVKSDVKSAVNGVANGVVKFTTLKMMGAAQSVVTGSDAVVAERNRGSFAVFDGGEKNSGKTAKLLAERVKSLGYQMRIRNSNDLLALAMQAEGDLRNMGARGCVSSVIAQIVQEKGGMMLYFVSAGSARLYLVRDGNAMQISKDEVARGKVLNGFLANNFALRQKSGCMLERGDKIVILTDGVYDGAGNGDLTDEEVAGVVNYAKSDTAAAKGLVMAGRKNDDRTVVVVSV